MNKEELLECLKSLSTTNNKRDGIDIKKEEAELIIEIINNYKKILDKIKEWKKQTLFDLNRQCKTFEYWEELFEDLDKLLEEIDSETRK